MIAATASCDRSSVTVLLMIRVVLTDLLDADGLSEDAVLVLLLQLAENGSQQDVEGSQLDLQHRLLLLHLQTEHSQTPPNVPTHENGGGGSSYKQKRKMTLKFNHTPDEMFHSV